MYTLKIEDHFKLPIHYVSSKSQLKDNVIADLELVETIDPSGVPLYQSTFAPTTEPGKTILKQIPNYYTCDIAFLKDTQTFLKTYRTDTTKPQADLTGILELWNELKNDTGFKEKYHYVDWSYWEYLNKSETFLQIMSMYSLASPFLSMLVPLIILVVPFFVIKAKGLDISMSEYTEVLKVIASNHAIGKLCTNFNSVPIDQKMYLLLSAGFYVFSIYQNFLTCARFYKNMKHIHTSLCSVRNYITHTTAAMNELLEYTRPLQSYAQFNDSIQQNIRVLNEYKTKLENIQGDQLTYRNIQQIGQLLKYFYEMYESEEYNAAFSYSFGFHGFIENMNGLITNIKDKKIAFATYQKKKKTIFKKAYYAALIHSKPIKNDIKVDKNLIITGPNASGKTTTLKTALINVVLTQQFGCGFYKSGNMMPYQHIHCYLNIPDTSGRDSLFQAEARRCKDIIDVIKANKKDRHFCVFDELYSGTNPDEAVMSANAFMEYLVKFENVKCILTTHFIAVCKKLNSHQLIENYQMETTPSGDSFNYTYVLKKGISEVRGGIKVLHDMQYPDEIIQNSRFNNLDN
jgi:putative IMPACT (imprinted ancient) family translation regulator